MARSVRHPIRLLATALAVGLGALVFGSSLVPSADATIADARARRDAVRAQQAQVASQVDALESSQDKVLAALSALDNNVRGQQATQADAERRAVEARTRASEARRAADELTTRIDALRSKVAQFARSAYVSPPGYDLIEQFHSGSAQEDATRQALLELHSSRDLSAIDELRAARQELDDQLKAAEKAEAEADAQAKAASAAMESLTRARSQQAAFADQVRVRLDERLSDAAYLGRLDSSLSNEIVAAESALAAAVSSAPTVTTPPSPGSPPTTIPPVTRPPLTTVGGITVASSIADQVRQLLQAASAAGIQLSGYGYRDINAQIALRRQNCGTSDYAIWQKPPDQCSPPTARPGYSYHEQGLAIDFQYQGSFIRTRTNPAFVWLAANAARYGLYNLPSEPWHWDTHPH